MTATGSEPAGLAVAAHLSHDEALLPNQLEADLVRHDAAVAVGDVRKGAGVHQHRRALQRLQAGAG
jgi:hypothetical protein